MWRADLKRKVRPSIWRAAAVVAVTVLPVAASLDWARHEAATRQRQYVMAIATKALTQTERTSDQLAAGAKRYNAVPVQETCSDKGLSLLREIDLESTLLQAAGHITSANVMDCSSVGGRAATSLGPPQFVSWGGARIWTDVRLVPGDAPFVAVAQGQFVGIVHKQLALEFVDKMPGLAVAAFSWSTRKVLIERGNIPGDWLRAKTTSAGYLQRGDTVVAVRASLKNDIGAIAALSRPQTAWMTDQLTMVVVLLGALVGLLSAALIILLARARLSMPAMIRAALRGREFHLLYQPVVELASGRIIGAEALIRWTRPDGEIIPPDHFIGIAEQAGVIRLITARVLELLELDVREVLRTSPKFHFAVNFAAADIHSSELSDTLVNFCRRSGLPTTQLIVEATERSFVDAALADGTLRRIRGEGILVAIDDFGTGYSNLGHLARLELDLLKIDKLFVDEIGNRSACSEVAERVIGMAKALNLKIVAEGVETSDQAERLLQLDVDYAQGYYFARPLPVDELLRQLRAQRRLTLVSEAPQAA
jgi:sensor c-di-GMP phosphodiesterase-like protein